MYEIRPESIITFVNDSSIKLPRFQRKQTWDDKRNFELCISIFKDFPIGVCILNIENDQNKTTKWLLDGRQRRNALIKISEDPEIIYLWAKKWLGLKNNDQLADVENKFWDKINEYLEEDENDDIHLNLDNENNINNQPIDIDLTINTEVTPDVDLFNTKKINLDLLIEIIKLIHNQTNRYSGFTRPFDFANVIVNQLPYEIMHRGGLILNSKRLTTFIDQYFAYCRDENYDYDQQLSFKNFLVNRFRLNENQENRIENVLRIQWQHIVKRFDLLIKIRNIFGNAKIGLIEVRNIKITDAQKIFNIINSKGTKLNAVEILSAKPSWNYQLESPSDELKQVKEVLYNSIQVRSDNVVKWDLPATFIYRLDFINFFLKSFNNNSTTDFEKQITLGFKIIAGIFQDGVKKEEIDKLSILNAVQFHNDVENLLNDLNTMFRLILNNEYFKFLNSWKFSMMQYLSDGIAINFIIIVYNDWVKKGKPIGNDTSTRIFQKNCFILLDQLIFEYVTKQWRGSSDTKVAQNIRNYKKIDGLFSPINEEKWINLISDILNNSRIESEIVTTSLLASIIFHNYSLRQIQGPHNTNDSIEIEHIIPQSLVKSSTIANKDEVVNNLYNLSLFTKRDNVSKGNKRLNDIDNFDKNTISNYTNIPINSFDKFSNLENWNDLKELRSPLFLEVFLEKRNFVLSN